MKLPFNAILAPILKPYLGRTRMFCNHATFAISLYYTYVYGVLGVLVSANHLRKHLGEAPPGSPGTQVVAETGGKFMVIHDLKIIATAMGLVQYSCLVIGCLTENPSLFLPHLFGQLVVITVKTLNIMFVVVSANMKEIKQLFHRIPAVALLAFNGLQEFCVFRQFLCICDL